MSSFKVFRAIPELCTGCQRCELTCSLEKTGTVNPAYARLKIFSLGHNGSYRITLCRHCRVPACKEACPIPGAMYEDEGTGAIIIDEHKCIGCRECVYACPFDAIQIGPQGEVLKCDLCGGNPVCVAYCQPRPERQFAQLPYPRASCLEYAEPHKITKRL